MAQGAITTEDREFTEEWENIATPQHTIIRFDVRGDLVHELISTRRHFHITSAERKITQDKILLDKNDPFLNGSFRPVVVPDSVNIESNPNALSDDEIKSILISSAAAWEGWLEVIDSADTLTRMMDLADSVEGVSLKRYKTLGTRLRDVRPKTQLKQKDRKTFEAMR